MKKTMRETGKKLLAVAVALGMVYAPAGPPPARAQGTGDDIFLLTASTSPNVILLMDNSKSMQHIEWHPAFDPAKVPDASYCTESSDFGGVLDPDAEYAVSSTINNADCDNPNLGNRKVWGPGGGDPDYIWSGRYLMWYLGLPNGDPIIDEIATAKADVEGCTQAGGAKDFDDKYRRSRLEASKQVLLDLLCVAEPKNVRFGLAYYRDTEDPADEDPNGGYVVEDLGRSNPNHAAQLEAAIKNVDVNDEDVEATPLAESLFQIYTYWMSRTLADIPLGNDSATQFPRYQYAKDGDWETNSNSWLEDPMLFECEKAFVVIVTDGVPTRDDFDVEITANEATGYANFGNLIGDYHDDDADSVADAEVPGDADESSWYLDDIAAYAQDHDFRPDLAGDQRIDTYTIGLATDATFNQYLQKTADLGNGLFFEAKNGDQLQFALIQALNDIIEKASSFTAAAVPSARTIDGGDFYQSFFIPQGRTAFWEGHVRAWHIAQNGDILDKNGNCALDDPDAGECNSGPFKPDAEYFWDAQEVMPQPGARALYTTRRSGGVTTRVPFDAALTAADMDIQPFAAPPAPAPNDPDYPVYGSNALNEEGLADEIVAYGRGCFFGSGVTDGSLTAVPQACLTRPSRLGDIFHSNPVVVRQPNAFIFEPSYKSFKQAYASRSRRIYAGTNAGFLEAFDAGTWVTPANGDPPYYTAGNGAEVFGFMPSEARLNVRKLPIDDPSNRSHYVDGSPQVADLWIHPTGTAVSKAADGSEWRTMLAGGMRRGGRQYYAIDVTNPDGIAGPAGNLQYPGLQDSGPAYGWEFPEETDPNGWLPLLGETWGQPIITRVRVDVDGDGIPRERWVAVVTGGFDYNGDPTPIAVNGRVSTYSAVATEGRAIFMLDMKTGEVLARKKLDAGASDAQTAMLHAMPSTPAVFDLNADGFADLIVVGNLGGKMFKWVVKDVGGDPINGSSASDDVDQPNWPFVLFFQAPVDTLVDDHHQNFFFPPAGAIADGKLWLAWGAGERRHLGYEGSPGPAGTAWTAGSDDENNRLYVVYDPDPLELAGLGTVNEGNLVDATNSPGGVALGPADRGFFIKGADGEKFVTNSVIFAGHVITSSFIPTPSADPCASRGRGTAYVFNMKTGEGFFRDGSNNPTPRLDLGVGLPTDPKVSVGLGSQGGGGGGGPCGTGQGNRVYIEKSGADLESFEACDIPTGGQLLYWRER